MYSHKIVDNILCCIRTDRLSFICMSHSYISRLVILCCPARLFIVVADLRFYNKIISFFYCWLYFINIHRFPCKHIILIVKYCNITKKCKYLSHSLVTHFYISIKATFTTWIHTPSTIIMLCCKKVLNTFYKCILILWIFWLISCYILCKIL